VNRVVRISALAAAFAAAVGAGGGPPGTVISSFLVPGVSNNGPRGLAFDGGQTYAVADDRNLNQVRIIKFSYDGNTASVLSSFNCPVGVRWALDIAWRPGYIYVANDLTAATDVAKVMVVNDATGSVLASFAGPYAAGVHVNGLTWDGTYLYASSYEDPRIFKLDANGAVLSSFTTSHARTNGLAFDGDYLWAVATRGYYDGREYSIGGALLASFTFNVNDEYVGGACRGRPAYASLFVSTYSGAKMVYEISTRESVAEGVTPASWGRIKTLFR